MQAEKFIVKKTRNMAYYTQSSQVLPYTFYDLVKDLIPDQNNAKERMIKGCQIFMPETVFFKEG